MKTETAQLANAALFAGIDPRELHQLLDCLGARQAAFARQAILLAAGERPAQVGLLLTGEAEIYEEDYWGNRSLLARVGPGEMFGEAFCCAGLERSPVSVAACTAGALLWLDYQRVLGLCPSGCPFHTRLIRNMLWVLAQKNIELTGKIRHLAQRTIREKLMSYLSAQALRAGSGSFALPFDRQGLADYLAVDRSALSRVLGQLQREGVLAFRKNQFTLLR